MGWFLVWGLLGAFGAWLRWIYVDPLVERLWADSAEAGGGVAARDSIHQLGQFLEGAGAVLIVVAVFMSVVHIRRLRDRRQLED